MIRKAKREDLKSICMSVYNKKIDYITVESVKEDYRNGNLYIIEENGKILGQCALVPKEQYHAMQRLVLYNRKNAGRGITAQFINYFISIGYMNIGSTPWSDNCKMKLLLKRNGFEYQYQIDKNYEFWLIRA